MVAPIFHGVGNRSCPGCCPDGKGNRMAKERLTRRQKDISRLLREQKKPGKPKPLQPKKKK